MKFGESATKLLKKTTHNALQHIPSKTLRTISEEIAFLQNSMSSIKDSVKDGEINEEISLNYMILKNYYERNLRILRAYKFHKVQAYFNLVFKGENFDSDDIKFKEITHFINKRKSEFTFLDFIKKEPPLSVYVLVLTIEDCGMVMDEDGFIELKKKRFYYVKKKMIEHLIIMKKIKIIEWIIFEERGKYPMYVSYAKNLNKKLIVFN